MRIPSVHVTPCRSVSTFLGIPGAASLARYVRAVAATSNHSRQLGGIRRNVTDYATNHITAMSWLLSPSARECVSTSTMRCCAIATTERYCAMFTRHATTCKRICSVPQHRRTGHSREVSFARETIFFFFLRVLLPMHATSTVLFR
jgi:hypothetical protein